MMAFNLKLFQMKDFIPLDFLGLLNKAVIV